MSTPKPPRVSRAIRLTKEVDQRLLAVCERLGVNPNAYLLHVVGQAIARDETSMRMEQASVSVLEKFMESSLPALMGDGKDDLERLSKEFCFGDD